MEAVFNYFQSYVTESPMIGGCPLLNAAIEADDALPELKKVLISIVKIIHKSISKVLENGIKHGQLEKNTNANAFSSMIFSSLEGAIMLTKVTNDSKHLQAVLSNLKKQFEDMLT
jgi:hypothetical protein